MKRLIIAGLASLALAGCNAPGLLGSPATTIAKADLATEKALYTAEAALDGVSITAKAAADSGALKGASAQRVLDDLDRAHAALILARAAYKVGDLAAMSANIALSNSAVADAQAIAKPQ